MKAIQVKQFGEPEVMQLAEVETPSPKDDEILVKVEAAGVNPVDTYIRSGVYAALPDLPYTPGSDISGTIVSTGKAVTTFQAGDRVYSSGTVSGGYADYAVCLESQIFALPANVDFVAGAAIGVPAATAYRALFIRGEAQSGEKLLIHGASGSVGYAAVRLAKAAGMEVYGTASTMEGLKHLEKAGVSGSYNHGQSAYVDRMKEDHPAGFDLILEMLANKNLEHDLELLATGGRVVVIGNRGRIEIDPRVAMKKEADIRGLILFNSSVEQRRKTHAALFAAMESGAYSPLVSKEMSLQDAVDAHKLVMENGNCGKIILKP